MSQYYVYIALILVTFVGGILKSLLGWTNAVQPDGTKEPWSIRMFLGSMINVFIAAVGWVGITYIGGAVTIASFFGAFAFGAAGDDFIHMVQKQVTPALVTPSPTATPLPVAPSPPAPVRQIIPPPVK